MTAVCVVCKTALEAGRIRLRYEGRYYEFDRERCKIIFQENPAGRRTRPRGRPAAR